MGITAIQRHINNFNSPITITIIDHENSSVPPVQVNQGSMADRDMWIPWCTSQKDFDNGHYITITGSKDSYYIWQAAHSDGDFVRYSTTGYQEPGTPILNDAGVNGDRCIVVDENGPALWRFGSSVEIPFSLFDATAQGLLTEHANWHMQHMPPFLTGEGMEFLQFHCQFLDQFHAWYDSQSFANQSLVAPWGQLPSFFGQVNASGQTPGATYISDEQKFRSNPSLWGVTDDATGLHIQSDVHNWGHVFAMPTIFNDPFMSDFSQAPRSIYFYKWHGLINGWWRTWQRAMAPSGWTELHCQPLPPLDARCISQSVPTQLNPGQNFTATITMQNIGTATWTSGGTNPFRLGSQAPQDNTSWGVARCELPSSPIFPGQPCTFTLNLHAPTTPGSYTFQWRMLQELVTWFGAFTPPVTISVGTKSKEKDKEKEKEKDHKDLLDGTGISSQASMLEVLGSSVESINEQAAHDETFISSAERPPVGQQALEEE